MTMVRDRSAADTYISLRQPFTLEGFTESSYPRTALSNSQVAHLLRKSAAAAAATAAAAYEVFPEYALSLFLDKNAKSIYSILKDHMTI
jgi:hypothetical protein